MRLLFSFREVVADLWSIAASRNHSRRKRGSHGWQSGPTDGGSGGTQLRTSDFDPQISSLPPLLSSLLPLREALLSLLEVVADLWYRAESAGMGKCSWPLENPVHPVILSTLPLRIGFRADHPLSVASTGSSSPHRAGKRLDKRWPTDGMARPRMNSPILREATRTCRGAQDGAMALSTHSSVHSSVRPSAGVLCHPWAIGLGPE